MEALARVDAELCNLLRDEKPARVGGVQLARLARAKGRISDETLKAIERMAFLRDLAAPWPRASTLLLIASMSPLTTIGARPRRYSETYACRPVLSSSPTTSSSDFERTNALFEGRIR